MQTANHATLDRAYGKGYTGIMLMVILAVVLAQFAMDAYLPSLPAITTAFGTKVSTIQLTITFFLVGSACSQLIYGPLSDAYGRRPVLFVGIAIYMIGSLGCAVSGSATMLIATRVLQGFGAGASLVTARSTMSDIASGPDMSRLLSYLITVFSIAPAIAPTLGGYIAASWGWEAVFFALFFLALAVGIVNWVFLPETNQQVSPESLSVKKSVQSYCRLLSSKVFFRNLACWCMAYAGFISYLTISPFLLQGRLGLTAVQYGWSAFVIAGAFVLGSISNTLLVKRFKLSTVTKMGIVCMMIGGSAMLLLGLFGYFNLMTILVPMLPFLTGAILVNCNVTTNAFSPFPDIAGSASALFGCLPIATGALISVGIAALHLSTVVQLGGILTALGLLAWLVKPEIKA